MFTWIYKNDLFKKKGICLQRKSWNNFYFSAESTFQESVSKQNFYACAGAKKKVMLLQHSTCILSSVKLPSFKLNITLYFKCYLHHNCNINLNWNNTQLYSSVKPLRNVSSSAFWFINFCFLPFLRRTSLQKWKKNWFCYVRKWIDKKEMSGKISKYIALAKILEWEGSISPFNF